MKKAASNQKKHIVLFVEGDTDKVFFEQLLKYYRQQSTLPLNSCEVRNLHGVTRYSNKVIGKLQNEICPAATKKGMVVEAVFCSMGVFYVSIILYAFRENEGFRLHLSANTDAYFKETMAILRAFASEDSGVEFSSWSGLQGKDMIHFSPQPNRYHGEEYLPGPDRNISRKMVEQVIANTKWERVSKLKARQK